jgi:hypothetical protein
MQGGRDNPQGISTVRQLLQQARAHLGCLGPLFGPPVHLREQGLKVGPVGVFLKGRTQLGDCLRVEFAVGVHAGQRPACEADLVGLQTVATTDQAAKFLLDGWVGWIGLESAFHVPDRCIEVALILSDDGHADVSDEVVGDRGENALEEVGRVPIPLRLKIRLAKEAIRLEMFGVDLEHVTAMRDRLVELFVLDKVINLLNIGAQSDIGHRGALRSYDKYAADYMFPQGWA